MTPFRRRSAVALAVATALTLTACGSDDGAGVRDLGGSGSGSGGSGSGSGSGSGLSASELSGGSDDPLVQQAVDGYRTYVDEQVTALVIGTTAFTDAIRAGDLAGAQAAYAPSRVSWERIEPIAGLIEDVDVAVDARVDDFASEDDPTWTGWHRIEYLLWEQGDVAAAAPFADQLDADLAGLAADIDSVEITPLAVTRGAAELVEEVSQGKITGEEDRYSHTDLWDFQANIDGARAASELIAPALTETDPELAATVAEQLDGVDATLDPYRQGEGFASFTDVTPADLDTMKVSLAALSESLATVPGTLGLS